MKEVLFATTNPAKIKSYEGKLKEKGIKLKTIKDLDINIEIEENGKNAIENACIKAKTYYDITKIPSQNHESSPGSFIDSAFVIM